MITDEGIIFAARKMETAADRAQAAADRMEAAVHRFALMLEDGYGGNGLRLIEELQRINPLPGTGQAIPPVPTTYSESNISR